MTAPRSVWLVGLSGAGKSAVGPLLAHRMGYEFIDLDAVVEALAGQTIPEIFRAGGEAGFRELEAEATRLAASRRGVVVATGGGWMARSDIQRSWEGSVRVWLRVGPETAIHRLTRPGEPERPLLQGDEPRRALERQLRQRRAAYAEAEHAVDTEGVEPARVAALVHDRIGAPPGAPERHRAEERT